jgi:glycosyltransferase involved in cell wall biosynthesis
MRRRHPPRRRTVLIVQQYVPDYRLPFFRRLSEALAARGVALRVSAGAPRGEQAARGDAVADAADRLERRIAEGERDAFEPELVVAEQAIRHPRTHRLLLSQPLGGPPVALWGHGGTYVKRRGFLANRVLDQMTRRAHWFFAYTRGGAQSVASSGYPPKRITVVQNAANTEDLERARTGLSADEIRAFRERLRLPDERVALYMGGLDRSKRLDFLMDAGARIAAAVPGFTLLVAGDGVERPLIERAASETGWVRYVGRAAEREKALLGAVSDLMLMPGRVGLAIVDGFALRTPVVTTTWRFHSAEIEYLRYGRNGLVVPDDVGEYAAAVSHLLTHGRERLQALARGCAESAGRITLARMVENFSDGILRALEAPRRRA